MNEVKVFDKTWQDLSVDESRLKQNQIIIFKKRAYNETGGVMIDGFTVARMEEFPRSYNPNLVGGRDIAQKAVFWDKKDAIEYANMLQRKE